VEDGTDSPAVKKQNSNYYRNIGIAAVCAIIIIVIVVTLSVIYSREIEGDKIVYTAPTMSPTTSTIQELSVATSEVSFNKMTLIVLCPMTSIIDYSISITRVKL
jgi:hypothetical protein